MFITNTYRKCNVNAKVVTEHTNTGSLHTLFNSWHKFEWKNSGKKVGKKSIVIYKLCECITSKTIIKITGFNSW